MQKPLPQGEAESLEAQYGGGSESLHSETPAESGENPAETFLEGILIALCPC